MGARPPRRPGSAGDHRPATADAEASRCLPVLWPARSTGSRRAAPTGARPGSWPQDPRSHAAWPGPESLPHRALRDLRPSHPGSAAIRSGRADAARATARHPALRASAPTALHGSVAGAAAPALTAFGRSRPRTRPCCVLTPDRRGWHSRGCRRPALAKTFLPGRIRQGPSMYEMEGPCPASPRPLASCLAWPTPRAARRGQIPARGPVSRLLPRSRGRPRVVPVSSGESISTASATTAQGSAASYFLFFRYPRRNPQKAGSYPHFTAVIHGFIHSLPTGYRVEAGEHLNRCRRTKSADRLTATSR